MTESHVFKKKSLHGRVWLATCSPGHSIISITIGSPKRQTKRAVRVKMVKLEDFERKFRWQG